MSLLYFPLQQPVLAESVSTKNVMDCIQKKEQCAQQSEDSASMNENLSSFSFGDGVKIAFSFLFVIALLIGFLFLLRKIQKGKQLSQAIYKVGSYSLTQNKSIQFMRMGDIVYILGVGDDVTLIQQISWDEFQQLQKVESDNSSYTAHSFANFLKQQTEEYKEKRAQLRAKEMKDDDE